MKAATSTSAKAAPAKQEIGPPSRRAAQTPHPVFAAPLIVQRKCACGGECPDCLEEQKAGDGTIPIQAKLALNLPGDLFEREADQAADRVMRMTTHPNPGRPVPLRMATPLSSPEAVHRHTGGLEGPKSVAATNGNARTGIDEVLAHPGQPLDRGARAFFEPRFGYDFSAVRVHADARAAGTAAALNARAYTAGRNIVFASGEYAPGSDAGRRLLAHELAHVLQQSGSPASVPAIQRQPSGTVFTPGDMHDHQPSGKWSEVQKNPNSGDAENAVCSVFEPATVMEIAMLKEFGDKPIAREHLDWYLEDGGGKDFKEDANLKAMLQSDTGVQKVIATQLPSTAISGGTTSGHLRIDQTDYQVQDFRFAFGNIDRMDFEADVSQGTVHVWFQDRYEFHPVYPFYKQFPTDTVGGKPRQTNCVHAAAVELKAGTAADFWMFGETIVPLSLFNRPTPAPNPIPAPNPNPNPAVPTPVPSPAPDVPPGYTQCDFIDEHIAVEAQRALYRLYRHGGSEGAHALGMLGAVKSENLVGIYQEDQGAPAQLAVRQGKGWWQLLPSPQTAAVILDESPPMMVFARRLAPDIDALAGALDAAWTDSPPGQAPQAIPPPSGRDCPNIVPPPKKEVEIPDEPSEDPVKPKPGGPPQKCFDTIDWDSFFAQREAECAGIQQGITLACAGLHPWITIFPSLDPTECSRIQKIPVEQRIEDCVVSEGFYLLVMTCGLPSSPPGKVEIRERYRSWSK